MKIHPYKEKSLALFLSGKNPNEIAALLPVKASTVYKWKKEGNWRSLIRENEAAATLSYIRKILKQEKERCPEDASKIDNHLIIITQALIQPRELMRERIVKALNDIDIALKENLI